MMRALPVFLLLAGCAASVERAAPVSRPVAVVRPTAPEVNPAPRPAAELIIGSNAAALISLFGQPELDVQEGPARKLQFSGARCVLDAYLYPPGGRGEAVATYIDARLLDGSDTDRTACAEALRQR